MKVQNHVRIGHSDKVFNVLVYILMSLILLLCAYPLYFVVIASFSDPAQVNIGNVVLFPKEIMFDGYKSIIRNSKIWTAYRNTILYTVLGTTLNVCLTVSAGFSLSRKQLMGRSLIMKLLTCLIAYRRCSFS